MSSEQQCWDILGNHFKSKGFVEHQISSFNKFLTSDIAKVITEEPPIVIEADKETSKIYKKYTILFSNVHIPSPTVIEEDRTLRGFTPCEARQRDLTYDSPIYVNITTILELPNGETEIEKFNRVVLGRMPIMLRSCLCYLSQMTPGERVTSGECPKDEGGYFIVRGKERVLIPQIRGIYNEPKVYEQKAGNKFKYVAEIRSMSEETGHSALLKAMVGFDNRTIVFSLPYIKDNIPVGVVFKALGYTQDQEIIDLIALRSEKTSKYIRLILRDAYLCEEQSNGYSLFEETENGTLEDWEKLSPEEQKGWQQKMTVTNALNYIGQFSQHTIKDHERENYAKQVIENELFPHMGITATIKEKSYFLGYIVNKLIATHCGLRKDDDKDDYINKRVESPGILCYELFRQLFKKYCQAISSSIEKKKQVPDAMTIITRLLIITNGIRHCFGTGNWGVPKNSYIRTGVCQVLSRLSYGATISNLRRLTIPIGKESKNTKIRQIHPSQIMYICPCECFDPETQILMWDGSHKKAANIVVGDMLIDDLGNPVRVRSTCSGIKNMYDVIPTKCNFTKHRVTDNHILTLKIRQHKSLQISTRKDRKYTHIVKFFNRITLRFQEVSFLSKEDAEVFLTTINDDDILDITIEKYLQLPDYVKRHLVIFKVPNINWEYKPVLLDPRILGMWLGDGISKGYGFALNYKTDTELLDYWNSWGAENNATITKGNRYNFSISATNNNHIAPLASHLRKYNLINNKHIPDEYMNNSRQVRMELLAGMIDTDGSVRAHGREIRICQGPQNYQLIEDFYKLSISLGFSCSLKDGKSQWTDPKTQEKKFGTYKELTITGNLINEIPTILHYKKLAPPKGKTQENRLNSFTSSMFELKEAGMGPYVGWQLDDPKGRFCLAGGEVVHNTPEGQSIGIVLNLSLLTRISERTPTVLIKEIVEQCDNIISIQDFEGPNQEIKVFLNGILIGITKEPFDLLDELKQLRKIKLLPHDVSISYDDLDEEIKIYSDDGRLIRPVFTLDEEKENTQLKITPEDGTNWDELVDKGLITYIDNNEINNAVVAFHPNELTKYHNDYCEIAPAMMLGVMASIIPFSSNSQSPRNCYQSSMGKQAMSIFALSHLVRADTVTHVFTYPQKPLVSTRSADMMGFSEMPSGLNAIVAIACYTGKNQEDSVILNKSAVDRGLFWATTYKTHSEEEKKQGSHNFEKIGTPPLDKRRKNINYSLLDENGIIRKTLPQWTDSQGNIQGGGDVYVEAGDAIIGKLLINSDKTGKEDLTDTSLVIKKGEEGYIDRIFTSVTPNGYKLVKVVIRTLRVPEVGDKFASRAGQKGTTGEVYPQEDMPYTESGIIPDIIMNPHAIPSRMTINQLMETVLGKSCCMEGEFGDATPFTSSSDNIAEELCNRLERNGFERTGKEMLYNGFTGQPMGMVFIGPVFYQRLKHLVSDKMHCLTQSHQVLCQDGWKNIIEVTKHDFVATLVGGKLVYENPINIFHYPNYKGQMYRIKNQAIDLDVTINHRMYVSTVKTQKRIWQPYELIMAKDLVGKHVKYKKDAIWDAEDYQFVLPELTDGLGNFYPQKIVDMDSWLTFFGIWIAEGWTTKSVQIAANKQRVKDALNTALPILGYPVKIYKSEKLHIYDIQLTNYMKQFSLTAPNKYLPEWCFELSREQSQKLIYAMMLGDGTFSPTNWCYATTSRKLADQFSHLCLHAGWSSMETVHVKKGTVNIIHGREVTTKHDVLRLSVIKTRLQPTINHGHTHEQKIQEEEVYHFEGGVYCIEVPSNVFMVRRNGKCVWTGNSRSTGPTATLTRQPLEGRSRAGGLRFGEMERDAAIAHGGIRFLKERLFEQSDKYTVGICDKCGNFATENKLCRACNTDKISHVNMPYVSKLVIQELNAMCIKTKIIAKD